MKIVKIIAVSVFAFITLSSQSQEKRTLEEIKRESIREKYRTPVKLSDAIRLEKERDSKPSLTKKRATELKLTSNSGASIEEGEAFIALNPVDNNKLVMSYMEQSPGGGLSFPVYYSNNGGTNWQKSSFSTLNYLEQIYSPNSFIAGGGDPVFSYDKNGKLYFSWIYLYLRDASSPDSIFASMFWATSTDNGATWTFPPSNNKFIAHSAMDVFSGNSFPPYEGFHDRQWFAHDLSNGPHSNSLYCSFIYFPNSGENPNNVGMHIRKKTDASPGFGNKVKAYSGQSQFGNVVVDYGGTLHYTFVDLNQNNVYHCSSTDGGASFSTAHQIATGTNLFGNQGNGFIHDRENSALNLAVDGSNHLHVVWTNFPINPGANYNSYYSKSTDGGVTWSAPKLLSFGSNKVLMPVVCAHGSKVTIGGYGVASNKMSDYYNMTSVDNGTNFWAPVKISTQQTDFASSSNLGAWFGDYFNSVRTGNKVYNVWSDSRGTGGTKMYVSTTLEPVGIQEVTPINGSYSVKNVYPNPSENVVNIEIESSKSNELKIQLTSIDGKVLLSDSKKISTGMNSFELNVDTYAAGAYILSLQSADNYRFTKMVEKR